MFLLTVVTQDVPYLFLEQISLLELTVAHSDGSGVILQLLHFCYFWYCGLSLSLVSLNLFIWFWGFEFLFSVMSSFYFPGKQFHFQIYSIISYLDWNYWWYPLYSFHNQYSLDRRYQILPDLKSLLWMTFASDCWLVWFLFGFSGRLLIDM